MLVKGATGCWKGMVLNYIKYLNYIQEAVKLRTKYIFIQEWYNDNIVQYTT